MGLVLWWLKGLKKRKDDLLVGNKGLLCWFGLDYRAKSRALKSLEQAGLITVQRSLGKLPIVTIVEK